MYIPTVVDLDDKRRVKLWQRKAGFILHARVYARIRAHTPTVGAAVYTSVAGCAQRIRAHTPTVAVKVQTC